MFDSSRLNFPFPLFTTSVHMLVQFVLACVVLFFVPSLRPQNAPQRRSDLGHSSMDENGTERPIMTKMFYLTRIGPCGAATGLDIGLGNTSLKFITLTFYSKCSAPYLPTSARYILTAPSNVQIFLTSICSPLRLPLQTRVANVETGSHHCNHDWGSHYDGSW